MLLPSYSVLPRRLPFSGDRMRDIITCVLGTLGFCVILNVSKRMIMPATLGGAISAVLFYVFGEMGYGAFISTLFATVAISVYSLATAKLKKSAGKHCFAAGFNSAASGRKPLLYDEQPCSFPQNRACFLRKRNRACWNGNSPWSRYCFNSGENY